MSNAYIIPFLTLACSQGKSVSSSTLTPVNRIGSPQEKSHIPNSFRPKHKSPDYELKTWTIALDTTRATAKTKTKKNSQVEKRSLTCKCKYICISPNYSRRKYHIFRKEKFAWFLILLMKAFDGSGYSAKRPCKNAASDVVLYYLKVTE